jgi:hypothetical protein
MTNLPEIKQKLGETTEKLESLISPHYTNLEPYQRGILLIALTLFLIFSIYYLTKPEPKLNAKKEAQLEEKLMRQMAFFKRLQG